MRTYYLRPAPGVDSEPGGYVTMHCPSGPQRIWVQLWRGRGVSVCSALFGYGRVAFVFPTRAILIQGLEVHVSHSRLWIFLWLFRRARHLWRRLR